MAAIVCFGECMIEIAQNPDGSARIGYGGDTLNTAVYLARLGQEVGYMTALGADPWSMNMRTGWAGDGIDLSLTLTHPQRLPGLYVISTDAHGERSFGYWREQAAVRDFFSLEGSDAALAQAENSSLLYLSGITLALFAGDDFDRVMALARTVRSRGGRVVFDPNYRARLWRTPTDACAAFGALAPFITIALPSFEDEALLWGDASPEATLLRWRGLGVEEIVVKHKQEGALTIEGWVRGAVVDCPIDTTGAGDSFNAGYLSARLRGQAVAPAAAQGAMLAAEVIQHRGAIIPRAFMRDAET